MVLRAFILRRIVVVNDLKDIKRRNHQVTLGNNVPVIRGISPSQYPSRRDGVVWWSSLAPFVPVARWCKQLQADGIGVFPYRLAVDNSRPGLEVSRKGPNQQRLVFRPMLVGDNPCTSVADVLSYCQFCRERRGLTGEHHGHSRGASLLASSGMHANRRLRTKIRNDRICSNGEYVFCLLYQAIQIETFLCDTAHCRVACLCLLPSGAIVSS